MFFHFSGARLCWPPRSPRRVDAGAGVCDRVVVVVVVAVSNDNDNGNDDDNITDNTVARNDSVPGGPRPGSPPSGDGDVGGGEH